LFNVRKVMKFQGKRELGPCRYDFHRGNFPGVETYAKHMADHFSGATSAVPVRLARIPSLHLGGTRSRSLGSLHRSPERQRSTAFAPRCLPEYAPRTRTYTNALSTYAQPLDNQSAHLASLEYVPHLALPFYPWGQSDISPRLKGNFEGGEHAARMRLQAGTQMSWWPPLGRGGYPRA